jgi:protein-S-isoprenylcysteine O-methyltransferase Ste14
MMNWKHISVLAFLAAVACLVWLIFQNALLGAGPVTIAIQVGACLLMGWARLTFGRRSFHAAANPTAGGLVTGGPYRYLRHPIYSAVLYFLWAGIAAHPSPTHMLVALLASALLGVRMFAEEQLLLEEYPEYADYARRTSRVLPFIF